MLLHRFRLLATELSRGPGKYVPISLTRKWRFRRGRGRGRKKGKILRDYKLKVVEPGPSTSLAKCWHHVTTADRRSCALSFSEVRSGVVKTPAFSRPKTQKQAHSWREAFAAVSPREEKAKDVVYSSEVWLGAQLNSFSKQAWEYGEKEEEGGEGREGKELWGRWYNQSVGPARKLAPKRPSVVIFVLSGQEGRKIFFVFMNLWPDSGQMGRPRLCLFLLSWL